MKVDLKEYWTGYGNAMTKDSALIFPRQKTARITLTGQVPNHKKTTLGLWLLLACHEVGHFLGGAPFGRTMLKKNLSAEGQADYYATNICMWKMLNDFPSDMIMSDFNKHSIDVCEQKYGDNLKSVFTCMRIYSAIISFVNYMNSTRAKNHPVSIHEKDESIVERSKISMPSDQCRVDNLMAGLLDQPKPACWFKAEE
jgi:hypothetical protein